jgi:hypothetical protein
MVSAQSLFRCSTCNGHDNNCQTFILVTLLRYYGYNSHAAISFFFFIRMQLLINDWLILITFAGISVFFVQSLQNDSQSRFALNAGSARECG